MKNILKKLKSKFATENIEHLLRYGIMMFVFLFAFSVPSFGSRAKLNVIMYGFMAILAILSIAYVLVFDLKINYKRWQLYLIPMFVILAFVGTALYSHSFGKWVSLVLLALSFYVLLIAFKIINEREIIALLLSAAIFAFSIYFIFHYRDMILNFSNFGNEGFRLGFDFDNPNAVSAVCVVGLSSGLYLTLFSKNRFKLIMLLPVLIIAACGICTGSRTFIVAVFIVVLTMLFFKFKNHKLLYLLVVISVIIFALVLLNMPFAYTIKQRFIRFFSTLFTDTTRVDTSTIERVTWFDYAFSLGFKNIILGYGADGFGKISGVETYSHSNVSEVFCDFGIIGLFLFYSPLVILVYKSIKYKKKGISYIFPIVTYYFIVSFSNVFYYNKFYYFNLAFMYFLAFDDVEKTVYVENVKEYIKRIVFTCEGMENGGAEKVISVLANTLCSKGYQVTIVGVASSNCESSYKLDSDVQYINIQLARKKRIKGIKRLAVLNKTLKSLKPDVVISFLPHVIVYTYFSMLGVKAPLIVSERNDPNSDPKGKILRLLKKYVFSKADGCVFQTEDAKNYFSKSIQKKSSVIHNPVSVNYEGPITNIRLKTIISVGRLTPQKNYDCLIDAFNIFVNKNPDYILKIYGDGPLKEELNTSIDEKGLSNIVKLFGVSPTWHQDEHNASLFVSSSIYEGMPNALAEAIALGIPCVATDCKIGGSKELIKTSKNGYLVPVNNPDALAEGMSKALMMTIKEEDAVTFKNKHSADCVCDKWLNYIKTIIELRMAK